VLTRDERLGGGGTWLSAAAVLLVLAVLAGIALVKVDVGGRPARDAFPPGVSGLPDPGAIRGAVRELTVRLHRVPDLALIQLEPGTITFQYYAEGRADRGSFIIWTRGRFGEPDPFRFPKKATVPQLRFDPAELRLDGVASADRLRSSIGLGSWLIVRAQGYRRGAPISDGSGLMWRVTLEKKGEQLQMFMNQAGRFLRIAGVPPPPPPPPPED
jgi:hypothetical protein